MGRLGMQLPGAVRRATPVPNIYTALVFAAVVALTAACIVVWVNGSRIGPEGNALGVHPPASEGRPAEIRLGSRP